MRSPPRRPSLPTRARGLRRQRKQLDHLTVRSPIDGIVAARPANAGDVVSPGTELFRIIDPRSMRLEAAVPSEALAPVKVGLPVQFEVRGYPGQHIRRQSRAHQPGCRSGHAPGVDFRHDPEYRGRLVAGLFAEGRVAQQSRRGLVLPATAVDTDKPKQPWVLRASNGKAERVAVTRRPARRPSDRARGADEWCEGRRPGAGWGRPWRSVRARRWSSASRPHPQS